ncbi:MAG: TonB-dependent receptor plug domain-containing protein, partial [Bacteroidales bacterium]|nr:TonB-dependent receptor plug domain-containing protein [Bacteroidales bacterium]
MTNELFHRLAAVVLTSVMFLVGTAAFGQNRSISGTVVDSNGLPVIGASVMVAGNNSLGTVTDIDGAFSLSVPAGSSLTVSCIGFTSQTVQVGQESVYNIVLQEDTESLEETVVIGYGTQKKKLLTGATINISGDDILKQSTTNALGAIYSSVPGVNLVQSSGGPGAGYSITVRGIGTTGSASPLVVIDGIASSMNSLNALNPADIESIDILKDAASAAIYGA